ncbi:MAG: nitrilase-related carbon-nitrogen hydrolase [Anaerolineae bacterium]
MAAVQWQRRGYSGIEELSRSLAAPIAEAVERGAALVAFPAGPGDEVARLVAAGRLGQSCGSDVPKLFARLGCDLARQYGATLSLGPVWDWSLGVPRRLAYLFGPTGEVLGSQAQTHRSLQDRAAGVVSADCLAPIVSPAGRLGLLTGVDVAYPEVSRILCLQGAGILIHHGAQRPGPEAMALRNLWREVQANQVFGLEALAVGPGLGGGSGIIAPVELTANGTGWLARAPMGDEGAVVVADLDALALEQLLARYPLSALRNVPQYRHYFPVLYQKDGTTATDVSSRVAADEPAGEASVRSDRGRALESRMRWPERLLGGVLRLSTRWRARAGAAQAAVQGLPAERAMVEGALRVCVGVVQFSLELVADEQAYARRAHRRVAEAVGRGAGLVVFPEYTSLPLLGLLPGTRALAGALQRWAAKEAANPGTGKRADQLALMALVLRLAAPMARDVYMDTFSTLAKRFELLLLAGSIIELDRQGRLCNVAYLFGPDGRVLARQVKTHLMPVEVAMGYGVGTEIAVVNTRAGRLAFPVCMDHTYFETARIAALRGADLLIDPAANNEYYNAHYQARGVWARVQEVHTYGVLCCGVGRVGSLVFEGRSGVYAPLELTPAGDGVVAAAANHESEDVVVAEIDYGALYRFREAQRLEFNTALYTRYLPHVYERDARLDSGH